MTKEITLSEFSSEISSTHSNYAVDINSLLGRCGSSPIKIHFETKEITIFDCFPEVIVLKSGKDSIVINQIQCIKKNTDKSGSCSYDILCGQLESLKTTVRLTKVF